MRFLSSREASGEPELSLSRCARLAQTERSSQAIDEFQFNLKLGISEDDSKFYLTTGKSVSIIFYLKLLMNFRGFLHGNIHDDHVKKAKYFMLHDCLSESIQDHLPENWRRKCPKALQYSHVRKSQ
jgi:hypothetical protein